MVKGNALLALSSLAVIVSKHEASLSSDSEGTQEVSRGDLNRGLRCVTAEKEDVSGSPL